MAFKAARIVLAAAVCVVASGCLAADAADVPPGSDAVVLSIGPDGTTMWNGEPIRNEPALEAKLRQRTQQTPKLQLDLQFHNVGQLSESNRKTLMDLVELTARFGYVHVENFGNGVRLTVLGPTAGEQSDHR
jgi:hypothetical protein